MAPFSAWKRPLPGIMVTEAEGLEGFAPEAGEMNFEALEIFYGIYGPETPRCFRADEAAKDVKALVVIDPRAICPPSPSYHQAR